MSKKIAAVFLPLMALAFMGCGFYYSATPTPEQILLPTESAQELPLLVGDWHITINQSGGIAGTSRTLEISGSGDLTIFDMRTNKQIVARLPADKLAELVRLVASSKYHAPSEPSGCVDCFIYTLVINNGDRNFQAQLDDVSLPDSGLHPLLFFLGKYLSGPN